MPVCVRACGSTCLVVVVGSGCVVGGGATLANSTAKLPERICLATGGPVCPLLNPVAKGHCV
eukprot:11625916-Prorocentrum_lima.AAC.1